MSQSWRKDDEGNYYVLHTHDGVTSEIPIKAGQTATEVVEEFNAIQPVRVGAEYEDHVWVDGVVVRVDSNIATPDTYRIIPDAVMPLTGTYTGYRPPYGAGGISVYSTEQPPASLLATLDRSSTADLCPWYGVKENSDGTWMTKIVEHYKDQPVIDLPRDPVWIARTYTASGEELPHYDAFFALPVSKMQKWCTDSGVAYPLLDDTQPWCYGVVWGEGSIKVKAYVRHVIVE